MRRHHLTDDRALHLRHDDAVDGKSERISPEGLVLFVTAAEILRST